MEDCAMEEDIVIKPVDTGYRLVITAELTPDEEEGGYSVYCPSPIRHARDHPIDLGPNGCLESQ